MASLRAVAQEPGVIAVIEVLVFSLDPTVFLGRIKVAPFENPVVVITGDDYFSLELTSIKRPNTDSFIFLQPAGPDSDKLARQYFGSRCHHS